MVNTKIKQLPEFEEIKQLRQELRNNKELTYEDLEKIETTINNILLGIQSRKRTALRTKINPYAMKNLKVEIRK
jgi:hypothetical protein